MSIKTYSRDIYLKMFESLSPNSKAFIDTNQHSDKYVGLSHNNTLKALVGIRYDKSSILTLKGLFSLEKGYGKKLIENVEQEFTPRFLRIDCYGLSLVKYYEALGFKIYFKHNEYYEMIKKI